MQLDRRLLDWLLNSDVSIQYQVHRDLLDSDEETSAMLQQRIEHEGWGARYLGLQNPNGHWGRGFYQPKWTCTHYTLCDLVSLRIPRDNAQARRSVTMMFEEAATPDGSINFARSKVPSDVCINGMALGYASYFGGGGPRDISPAWQSTQSSNAAVHQGLFRIVDFLLNVQMGDYGWNCEFRRGATHSSVHTTISVLEGLREFQAAGHTYRRDEIDAASARATEFLLTHRMFLSDKTGEVINKGFLMLSFPPRWHYDILRALDYFQAAGAPYDERMAPALNVLAEKRRPDGTWPIQAKHPGNVHFDMEETGKPSRWNTLRALRVTRKYGVY